MCIYITMINLQPKLFGKLVKIRPMKSEDLSGLYQVASDKLVWQQHPQPQRSQFEFFKNKYFQPGLACKGCLIFENNLGQIVGSSRYYDYRQIQKDIFIGYTLLARKCWGGDYNRQIKHLMLSHIYQWVNCVFFSAGVNNWRSRKAVEKIGGILLTDEMFEARKMKQIAGSVTFQIEKKHFKGLFDKN